jgi:hypothetical protein
MFSITAIYIVYQAAMMRRKTPKHACMSGMHACLVLELGSEFNQTSCFLLGGGGGGGGGGVSSSYTHIHRHNILRSPISK